MIFCGILNAFSRIKIRNIRFVDYLIDDKINNSTLSTTCRVHNMGRRQNRPHLSRFPGTIAKK